MPTGLDKLSISTSAREGHIIDIYQYFVLA